MRRVLVASLVLAAASLPTAANAQRWSRPIRRVIDHYYAPVELGLIGSVNRNTVTGAGPVDPRFRGSIGGFMSLPLGTVFRLRPEVMVSGKYIAETDELNVPFDPFPCLPAVSCVPVLQETTRSLTWLEIPVLLEARFRRALGGWGTPKVYGGPFVAVRLSCNVSIKGVDENAPAPTSARLIKSCDEFQPNATYNNGDAGFVLGAGVSAGLVGVGFRWTRSLVPVAPFGSSVGRLAGAKQSTLALTLELATRLR